MSNSCVYLWFKPGNILYYIGYGSINTRPYRKPPFDNTRVDIAISNISGILANEIEKHYILMARESGSPLINQAFYQPQLEWDEIIQHIRSTPEAIIHKNYFGFDN